MNPNTVELLEKFGQVLSMLSVYEEPLPGPLAHRGAGTYIESGNRPGVDWEVVKMMIAEIDAWISRHMMDAKFVRDIVADCFQIKHNLIDLRLSDWERGHSIRDLLNGTAKLIALSDSMTENEKTQKGRIDGGKAEKHRRAILKATIDFLRDSPSSRAEDLWRMFPVYPDSIEVQVRDTFFDVYRLGEELHQDVSKKSKKAKGKKAKDSVPILFGAFKKYVTKAKTELNIRKTRKNPDK